MYEILDKINNPDDIKSLPSEQIGLLAEEIREFLVDSVSKTGGHIASNLGVVELTIALLKTFNPPDDKIVFDVGHQSYVYKLLTGRKNEMNTLRQFGGIAGFPKRCESEYDAFNTGHASTSISAALGLSTANNLDNSDNYSIAVIGDGALSGGMSLEALGNAVELNNKCIIVLNDNNMSISKSVGGFSLHLNKLRSSVAYRSFKSKLENRLSTTKPGKRFVLFLKAIKDGIRHLISGQTLFENIGLTYFGPIDGHNVQSMSLMFERAKKINGPVLLHVITKKGKGYKFAEEHPDVYHGVSTFEASKCIEENPENITYSRVAGNTLCNLAEKDEDITVVTAAMAAGTGTDEFAVEFPERFYDVGIAEQHAVTFAAGLAAGGKKPFVVIYSSFLQRSYDQILHDVCLQNLNVTFLIDRAGVVGEDGETHHGLFDIGYMSQMPNMLVLAPANYKEFTQMIEFAASGKYHGPIAIRYPRGKQQFLSDAPDFKVGVPHIISGGKDVCILSSGTMAKTAVSVADKLSASGKTATVVNLRTLYPLNREFLSDIAFRHSLIVTLEDGCMTGGVGEKIAAYISTLSNRSKCINIGYPPIVTHGSCKELARHYGLDDVTITDELLKYLN